MTIVPLPVPEGPVLVIAPHMDDESLGCGLLLASHPRKESLHVLFVTDGSHSPEHARGASESSRRELAQIREREAREAAAVFGLPPANVEFLGLEDGTLAAIPERLMAALVDYVCFRRRAAAGAVPIRSSARSFGNQPCGDARACRWRHHGDGL